MFSKTIAVLVILAVAAVPAAMAQAAGGEMTVEMMVIRENSHSSVREQNLFALSHIDGAIGRGNTGDEIYAALERLVLTGTQNRVVARGRVTNNFPDVRQEAARQLGELGTEEARAIILRASIAETEPMVLQEMIAVLGNFALEDNVPTISAIVRVAGRMHRSPSPNNHVALAAVNALESIAERDGGLTYADAFWYLFAVAEGPYVFAVRERAWEVIDGLR